MDVVWMDVVWMDVVWMDVVSIKSTVVVLKSTNRKERRTAAVLTGNL